MLKNFLNTKEKYNQIDMSDILLEIDEETRKKLQQILLEMYVDILEVCNKYQLVPFLVGGSALGAVRHQGFIPWDDDLDIGMTREDYNKFTEIFEKELSNKYILSAPNYFNYVKTRFPKILKRGTTMKEIVDAPDPEYCCVFLDIFILENIPDNKIIRILKGLYCNALEFISSKVFFYQNKNELAEQFCIRAGKLNYMVHMIIGKIFSFRNSAEWFNLIDKVVQCKNNKSKYCGLVTGRKHYFGEMMLREELFPVSYAVFENIQVPVYKNNDYYLKRMYGDYMQIPPLEKREKHFIRELKL